MWLKFPSCNHIPASQARTFPLRPKHHRQEVVDTATPYTPVMSAGEGFTDDVQGLALQHFVILLKMVEIGILGTHGTVKYLEAFIKPRTVL